MISSLKKVLLTFLFSLLLSATIEARSRKSRHCQPITSSTKVQTTNSNYQPSMHMTPVQPMTTPPTSRPTKSHSSNNLIELRVGQDLKTILSKHPNTVLYFYNDHCEPCAWMRPRFEAVTVEYPTITFVEINTSIDEFVFHQLEYKIKGWPSLVLYKNGQRIIPIKDPRNNELYEYLGGPRDEQGMRDVLNMVYSR